MDTYHALFPIYGTMKYRLGFDRLSWALFPLYVESVKKDTTTTYVPWPILRFIRGEENGFAIWPLFGSSDGPGARQALLLPLAALLEQCARARARTPPRVRPPEQRWASFPFTHARRRRGM